MAPIHRLVAACCACALAPIAADAGLVIHRNPDNQFEWDMEALGEWGAPAGGPGRYVCPAVGSCGNGFSVRPLDVTQGPGAQPLCVAQGGATPADGVAFSTITRTALGGIGVPSRLYYRKQIVSTMDQAAVTAGDLFPIPDLPNEFVRLPRVMHPGETVRPDLPYANNVLVFWESQLSQAYPTLRPFDGPAFLGVTFTIDNRERHYGWVQLFPAYCFSPEIPSRYLVARWGWETTPDQAAAIPLACHADVNADARFAADDITAFLAAWFRDRAGGAPRTDFNADGRVDTADVTTFFSAWLAGRAGAC